MTAMPDSLRIGKHLIVPILPPGSVIPVWRVRTGERGGEEIALDIEPGTRQWCLIERDTDEGWPQRHFCYDGGGLMTLLRVCVAAIDWEWTEDTTPVGWTRDAFSDDRRTNESWAENWFETALERIYTNADEPPSPQSADPSPSS